MSRGERSGTLAAIAGGVAALVLLNGGAYLMDASAARPGAGGGAATLACFVSVFAAPLGALLGYWCGRRAGRTRPPADRDGR